MEAMEFYTLFMTSWETFARTMKAELRAASADFYTRLGRGTCSNMVRPHQIHAPVRPHPPYL